MKKRLIIPIFLPQEGCPHRCIFCNQPGITGVGSRPGFEEVSGTIERYLSTWRGDGPREVAFYGGSFTGLPEWLQIGYLGVAARHVESGEIDSIRVSTRPDYIDAEALEILRDYGVETVELGVQSMADGVLRRSGRGHGSLATVRAVKLLKEWCLVVGIQLMPGLPGDTMETIIRTTEDVIALRPHFARIYPALVISGTPLEGLYRSGAYTPWSLDEMVRICREMIRLFRKARIPVIRIGLRPAVELEEKVVAGPYHPSIRQLVEQEI